MFALYSLIFSCFIMVNTLFLLFSFITRDSVFKMASIQVLLQSTVITVDRPVEFFHLHAGIAYYFHHEGHRFQNFGLQSTKWIKISVSL